MNKRGLLLMPLLSGFSVVGGILSGLGAVITFFATGLLPLAVVVALVGYVIGAWIGWGCWFAWARLHTRFEGSISQSFVHKPTKGRCASSIEEDILKL